MLTTDKLIFVELQKAGSTGLKKYLAQLLGGDASAKSSVYADELAASGKPVVGLVCHPLQWYVDQWRLGVEGKGEIFKRLTDAKRWDLMRSRRTNRTASLPDSEKPDPRAFPDEWGPEHAKKHWYAGEENVEGFREWLRAVIRHRIVRNIFDHGYHTSPVGQIAGPMTYHYVTRFVRDGENLPKTVATLEALREVCIAGGITEYFVRAEQAGEDLVRVLGQLGVELSDEQRTQALNFKRKGPDSKLVRALYDRESMRLVGQREALMIEMFGYEMPTPTAKDKEGRGGGKVAGAEQGKGKTAKAGKPGGGASKRDVTKAKVKAAGSKPARLDSDKRTKQEKEEKRAARQARQTSPDTPSTPGQAGAATKPKRAKPGRNEGGPATDEDKGAA